MYKSALDILVCPDLKKPLQARPFDTFVGSDGSVLYEKSDGVVNLLPASKKKNRVEVPSTLSAEYNGLSLVFRDADCFLGDVLSGNGREALAHVRDVIHRLPPSCYNKDGSVTVEGVNLATKLFGYMLQVYAPLTVANDKQGIARLTGAVNQARYEVELQAMGDYAGNFVLPREIRDLLPKQGNLVELAMGNGANLRLLHQEGNFDRIIGIDSCFGMVRAAEKHNSVSGAFYAIADAHHTPIKDRSADVIIMCNALDRLRDPDVALEEIARIASDGASIVFAQCMPLQYDIKIGTNVISCLDSDKRIDSLEQAVAKIPGTKIIEYSKNNEWHPITVTQGRENLEVDVVVAKVA